MYVVAAEGVVTLTGTAEQIAMGTPGVEKVNNLLTLNPQTQRVRRDPIVTDEELSKAVAGAIAKRFYPGRAEVDRAIFAYHYQFEGPPDFEMDADVNGSEVIFEGTVPDSRKIREIVQFVHRFPGVFTVDQQLGPSS